jgi:hypothetical protein
MTYHYCLNTAMFSNYLLNNNYVLFQNLFAFTYMNEHAK